jgi:signal transduction histidine kinase
MEALLGARLLHRMGFHPALDRVRDVVALVFLAAGLSTTVSASMGVFSLGFGGVIPAAQAGRTWWAWWLGDVVGDITVAPLLFVISEKPRLSWRTRPLEWVSLLLAFLGSSVLVFGQTDSQRGPLSQPYLLFPPLLWAALRFGQLAAVSANFLLSAVAITATAMDRGPFVQTTLSESLSFLQAFMCVAAITTLLLSAAASERDRMRQAAEISSKTSRFLAEASEKLASSLDYDTTLAAVAHLMVPTVGDDCIVDIVEPNGSVRRVAEASIDSTREAALRHLRRYPPGERSPVSQVIKTGATLHIPHFDQTVIERIARDDEHGAILGEIAPGSSLSVPLKARGKVIGAITFGRIGRGQSYSRYDISFAEELAQRAGMAVDNARLYQEAREAIRARDDFVSVASHELRTPLTSLTLQVDNVLRSVSPAEGKLADRLEVLKRLISRLTRLVDNLLDVSRLMAGTFAIELEDLDLREVVGEVVPRFRPDAERAGSDFVIEATDPCRGRWDRLRLEQVITNLLSNAIKFGRGRPIEVRLENHGEMAVLAVKDQGIGIAEGDRARIFQRFERAVSQRSFGGFGLGLWIVKQIATAMDGTIGVESEPDRWTVFTLELPRQPRA